MPEVFGSHPEATFPFNYKDFWYFIDNFFLLRPRRKTSKRPVEHLIPLKICISLSLCNSSIRTNVVLITLIHSNSHLFVCS